ncbi:MAG: glutamate cyclase domain-containing protein [Christensenellales bacterium]
MNRDELEKRNVGENLDPLMNLDPRGYGVCRILYAGSRKATGEPLTMHAAQTLVDAVKPGDLVYILTGFVLLPHKVPEMDGMVSSMLLARALVLAFDAKPIIVCPVDCVQAVKNCAAVVGLHIYEDIADRARAAHEHGRGQRFTKDVEPRRRRRGRRAAARRACPPPSSPSKRRAQTTQAFTTMRAAWTSPFWKPKPTRSGPNCARLGVPSVAIGDLGNEIGMGKIADHIRSFVPFTAHGECSCGCKGGILAQSTADSIITATCSDWGCYGLMAALAYLLRNIDILHTEEMEAEVMRTAARSGMIDMTGSLLPGIDGFNLKMNVSILSLMRQCTDYALRYSHRSDRWFGPVLEKHFLSKDVTLWICAPSA